MSDRPIDLNAARKARAGHADTGLCRCGKHLRMYCRDLCMGALIGAAIDPGHESERSEGDPPDAAELGPDEDYGHLMLVPELPDEAAVMEFLADTAYKRWREDRDQD